MEHHLKYVNLGRGYEAVVDLHIWDSRKMDRYSWHALVNKRAGKVYAQAEICEAPLTMHRFILNAKPGQQVDHRNGDGLDNRLENIRLCTAQQNAANKRIGRRNSSGWKGVTWSKASKRWMAQIVAKGVRYYLGVFVDAERAAQAHDRAAIYFHGEFAGLNFEELRGTYRIPSHIAPQKKRAAKDTILGK